MFKHILVPTDGSTLSQQAVDKALELARHFNAKMTALHVYPKFGGSPYGTYGPAEDVLEEAHHNHANAEGARLFATLRTAADEAGVACEAILVESNDVWQQIIATARKKRCDLICMASHGRRGITGVLLGSETSKVLTHSDIPVLVLR